ncbi:Fanconi anemia group J protein, partial [Rhizopus stolonifer]
EKAEKEFTKIPKIFVGSRTHKQITQLVQELRSNTRYTARTTILGSREQFCIHSKVSKSTTKNDDCTELLDENACSYFHKTRKLIAHAADKDNRIWDIEDLVELGNEVHGCPYFASRKIYEFAEVVFCPYNYIIDPVIRASMDIHLKDSIVILDEAHNIEDASRSAGSFEIDENAVDVLLKELELVVKYGGEKEAHTIIEMVMANIKDFFTDSSTEYTIKEYEKQSGHWAGSAMMQKLHQINISPTTFRETLQPAYKTIVAHADLVRKEKELKKETGAVFQSDADDILNQEDNAEHRVVRLQCLSNGSLRLVQGLFMVLGFLCDENHQYAEDYEMVLTKTLERLKPKKKRRRRRQEEQEDQGPIWVHRIAFWCLNPGIIFRQMSQDTRSVILTSGTLSPLNTFASELGTQFTGQLEANHVIQSSQVWVGAIPQGPNRIQLKGIYSNLESFYYQDEVGDTLLEIVQTVPYGVLCFLPSYKAMDILIDRWKLTGVMEKLQQRKQVLSEPKGSDKKEFESILNTFYHQIDTAVAGHDPDQRDGAIFFAVFRGKVSEGIDFSDHYCRAVVTLGIPYPGVKDLEVKLKREYNNKRRMRQKDVLSGQEWYSAQAYRAINQALGRCIRHRNDWGAIILLEERFCQQEVMNGLSKWVKGQFRVHSSYLAAMSSLKQFVARQMQGETTQQNNASSLPTNNTLAPGPSETSEQSLADKERADTDQDIEKGLEDIQREMEAIQKEIDAEVFIKKETEHIEEKTEQHVEHIEQHVEQKIEQDIQQEIEHIEQHVEQKIEQDIQQEIEHIEQKIAPHAEQDTNESMQDVQSVPQKTELFVPNTIISCKYCLKELICGPDTLLSSVCDTQLQCLQDSYNKPPVVQLINPSSYWQISSELLGGPLDIDQLPNCVPVLYNRQDQVCYRLLASTIPDNTRHVGCVYLWENKVKKLPLPSKELMDLSSQQPSYMDDIFYM